MLPLQWHEWDEDDLIPHETPDGRPKRARKLPARFRSRSPSPLGRSNFAVSVTSGATLRVSSLTTCPRECFYRVVLSVILP